MLKDTDECPKCVLFGGSNFFDNCWQCEQSLHPARQEFMEKFKKKRFGSWWETMEPCQPVWFPPLNCWWNFLYSVGDQLSSAFLINLVGGYQSFQQIWVPFLNWHMDWVERGVILHIFDYLEKLGRVIWRETWVWKHVVTFHVVSVQPGAVQGLLVFLVGCSK